MKSNVKKNQENFQQLVDEEPTVLVTGGAGFIGSNLISKLLKKNHEVICMDNLYSSNKNNIYEFLDHKNFEFLRHDVTKPFNIEVDQIYNLACPASPIYYQKDPVYTIKTSFYGALNVLDNAKRTKVRVLQASTSEIYGSPKIHPQKENYWGNVNPIGNRSCYDEGKRAAETLFFDYYREYNTNIAIARIFNTYGPKMAPNDGRVITNFILQALQDKPISIFGEGNQTRSFCFIDDLTEGIIKLMEGDIVGPVNLGNPEEITIKNLAKKIIKLTNSNSRLEFYPLPKNDPLKRKPDISLAKNQLNWIPNISLQKGLIKTIDYFKNIL